MTPRDVYGGNNGDGGADSVVRDDYVALTAVDTRDTCTVEMLPKIVLYNLPKICLTRELHDLEEDGLGKLTCLGAYGGYDNAENALEVKDAVLYYP